MNMTSDYDRKLAETLKSLSLEPSPQTMVSPADKSRRLFLYGCVLTIGAGAVLTGVAYWPDVAIRVKAALPQQWWSETVPTVSDAGPEAAPQPDRMAPAKVATSPKPTPVVAREITGSGYVVAPHFVSVFAKYEGRIASVDVEVGQHVEAGQVLVTLDDAGSRFALEQAQADKITAGLGLEAREIELEQANASLRRSEALAAKQAISRQDLEKATTAHDSALNALAQARQSLVKADLAIRIAQERGDGLVVRAPIAGAVTALDAHVGGTVLARLDSVRENQKLLSITDTSTLVIDADVAETNIGALRAGLSGEAVLDGIADRPFAVEILRIAPVASLEKGTVTLRLALRNPPDGIRPNMAARIRIAQGGETSQ